MLVRKWFTIGALMMALAVGRHGLPTSSAAADTAFDKSPPAAEARLKADLTYLSSDECEGRGPTTQGINKAAAYIAGEFKKAGLKPAAPDGSYFQPFTLSGAVLDSASLTLVSPKGEKMALKMGADYEPMGMSKAGKVSGELVFAGFGLANAATKYDDYAGLDVKDKIVVVVNELPMKDGKALFNLASRQGSLTGYLSVKAKAAADKGAQALIFVHAGETAKDGDDLFNFGYGALSRTGLDLPVFQIKRSVLEKMITGAGGVSSLTAIETGLGDGAKPANCIAGWKAEGEIQLTRDRNKVPVKNVVAVLEGSGPLANETVVVGAHYDHLGYGGAGGSLERGLKKMKIHHGADDNGSGSTSIMELARRFGAIKNREGRRLVFMTYSGEELGLLGSIYYCNNPLFPLKDTVAMVNLDMVGRAPINKTTNKNQVDVNGLDTAKEFEKLLDEFAPKSELEMKRVPTGTNRYFRSSDQFSFFQKNIPVIFFFTGEHPQYHRPTDTVDLINFKGMREIIDISEQIIARLSTDKARPTFVRAAGAQGGGARGGVSLGIAKIDEDGKDGVLIAEVVPDQPADKAGLKKGDRIIEAAGKPVKTRAELAALLQGMRRGDSVDLGYERDGKKMTVKVVFPTIARIGIQPDYEGMTDLVVNVVSDGGPAAKAGIKTGDRIVEIGGKPVKDITSYMTSLEYRKTGDMLDVVLLRDGKKMTVKIVIED